METTQTVELLKGASRARATAEQVWGELAPVTTLAALSTANARDLHERCARALRVARRLVAELEGVTGG
jgi:hypothetical protein